MHTVLFAVLFLLAGNGFAQHLTLSRMRKLQKDDFNLSNSFFVDNDWATIDTDGSPNTKFFAVGWKKQTALGSAQCKISYNRIDDSGDMERLGINPVIAKVMYFFDTKADYTNLRRDAIAAGWKDDKPVMQDGQIFSTYTNGNEVLMLCAVSTPKGAMYVAQVIDYAFYAVKYLNK